MPARRSGPSARMRSMTCVRRAARACARGVPAAALLRDDDDEQRRSRSSAGAFLSAVEQLVAGGRRLATTSVTSKGRPSLSRSMTTCSTGRPVASLMRSMRSRRSQPEDVAGIGRDDDLVGSVLGDGVHRRGVGVGVADLADGVDALARAGTGARGRCGPARRRRRRRRR